MVVLFGALLNTIHELAAALANCLPLRPESETPSKRGIEFSIPSFSSRSRCALTSSR
jgi:hypothetical protein